MPLLEAKNLEQLVLNLWLTSPLGVSCQIFTSKFITVAKSQLWSHNKITLWLGITVTWGTLLKEWLRTTGLEPPAMPRHHVNTLHLQGAGQVLLTRGRNSSLRATLFRHTYWELTELDLKWLLRVDYEISSSGRLGNTHQGPWWSLSKRNLLLVQDWLLLRGKHVLLGLSWLPFPCH